MSGADLLILSFLLMGTITHIRGWFMHCKNSEILNVNNEYLKILIGLFCEYFLISSKHIRPKTTLFMCLPVSELLRLGLHPFYSSD